MSLNTGNTSAWATDADKQPENQDRPFQATSGLTNTGLTGLWALTSMTSDGRNMKIVSDTVDQLLENYKRIKASTTGDLQRSIIPEVEHMTPAISSILPGISLFREIGGVLYVMGVLFSDKERTISSEYIRMNAVSLGSFNNGSTQSVSAPVPPANYIDDTLVENLRKHYLKVGEAKGIKNVSIINMVVQDMEMLNHDDAGELKDRPHLIANILAASWEEAVLVKIPQEAALNGQALPSPFKDPAKPYGKDGHAEARVSAISGRITSAKTLSAANMEVIASTMNNFSNNPNSFSANSKEIARVTGIVALNAQSFQAYTAQMAASGPAGQQEAIQRMMNIGGGIYPQGFRPLAPVITIEEASAGEMMGYNQGLAPFFYGLFLLMSTNNNFVFMEALRRHAVGSRGNLSNLEVRIEEMLTSIGGNFSGRTMLTDKSIADTDLVNAWIRQNVSPHATFQMNISLSGAHSPIHDFCQRLAGPTAKRINEVKTVMAIYDAMTNNAFSALVERNMKPGATGWTPDKPILHRTPVITVNGLASHEGKKLNTQEVDEMMLGKLKGPKGGPSIQQYLATQYGAINEDPKARCQKLRLELGQSAFDGDLHINGFAQTHIWDPLFMAVVGEAMESVGTLNVANNLGSFRTSSIVYAPGAGLATLASVGSNGVNGTNVSLAYGMRQSWG